MKIKYPKYKYKFALLIDDNDLDNFINEKMLEANCFSEIISIKTNGEIALDFLKGLFNSEDTSKHNCPDVIFVDLNMPVMNGFEFIKNFKKLYSEKLDKCKIVILTSSIHTTDRIKAEELDSRIIFINKPLTIEFLNSI